LHRFEYFPRLVGYSERLAAVNFSFSSLLFEVVEQFRLMEGMKGESLLTGFLPRAYVVIDL